MSRPRLFRRQDRVPVVDLQRSNPLRAGIVLVLVIVVGVYFGFTKHIPFKHGFQLKAEFTSAINIQGKSPVRVAGVPVGQVKSIERTGNTALVTMEIESKGQPIHTDATVKIRPRLFLEGNWFVELQPGSPAAGTVSSGYTIPIAQTADPVQLDQVLDALNTDTRANLQSFLINYGEALTRKPEAAEDAEQEPEVRGLNAAQALNQTYARGPKSLRGGAIDTQAVTGTEPDDLSKLVAAVNKVASALNVHEQDLSELFPNFNTFFASFAAQVRRPRATVAELPGALQTHERGLAAPGLHPSGPRVNSRTTSFPGVSGRPRRSRRRCRGSRRFRHRWRRASSAEWPRGSRNRPRPHSPSSRPNRCRSTSRPTVQQMPDQT